MFIYCDKIFLTNSDQHSSQKTNKKTWQEILTKLVTKTLTNFSDKNTFDICILVNYNLETKNVVVVTK